MSARQPNHPLLGGVKDVLDQRSESRQCVRLLFAIRVPVVRAFDAIYRGTKNTLGNIGTDARSRMIERAVRRKSCRVQGSMCLPAPSSLASNAVLDLL